MYRFISLQISIVDQPISRVRLVLFTDWIIIIAEFPKGPKNPKLRERCVQWVRETHAIVDPYAIKDPPEFGRSADWWTSTLGDIYGTNTPRLQQLKQKFDPGCGQLLSEQPQHHAVQQSVPRGGLYLW